MFSILETRSTAVNSLRPLLALVFYLLDSFSQCMRAFNLSGPSQRVFYVTSAGTGTRKHTQHAGHGSRWQPLRSHLTVLQALNGWHNTLRARLVHYTAHTAEST